MKNLEIKTYMTNAEKTRRSIVSALLNGTKSVLYLKRKVFADTFRAPYRINQMIDNLVENGYLVKTLDETKNGDESILISLNPQFKQILFENNDKDKFKAQTETVNKVLNEVDKGDSEVNQDENNDKKVNKEVSTDEKKELGNEGFNEKKTETA